MGSPPPPTKNGRIRRVVVARLRTMVPLGLAIIVTACSATSEPAETPTTPVLVDVVDGDTIVVRFSTGAEERVRLLGIDTPETIDPSRPVQCFGSQATEALSLLLPAGTPLRLERDVEARDRYGRLLGYIFRADDDLFVNTELLRGGFADLSIYPPNEAYRSELTAAVTAARTSAAGLWSACGGADVPLNPTSSD